MSGHGLLSGVTVAARNACGALGGVAAWVDAAAQPVPARCGPERAD